MDPEKINSPNHQRTMFETGQSLFENSPVNSPLYLHYSNLASSYQAFGSPTLFPPHFNLHSMFGSVGNLSTSVSSPCTSTSGAAWWPMSSRLLAPDYLTCSLAASTSSTAFGNVNHDLVFSGFDIFTHQMHPELCKTSEGKVSKRKSGSSHSSSKNSVLASNKLCTAPVYTNPITGVTITPINIEEKVANSKHRKSAFSVSLPSGRGVSNDKIVHTNSHIMSTGMHNLPVTVTSKTVHSDSSLSKSLKPRKVLKRTSKTPPDLVKQEEKNSSLANLPEMNSNGSESSDGIEDELHSWSKGQKIENSSGKCRSVSDHNDVGNLHSTSPMLTPPSLEPTAEIHSGPLNLSTKSQFCPEDSLQPPVLVPVVPPKQKKTKPKNSKNSEYLNKQILSTASLGQKIEISDQQMQNSVINPQKDIHQDSSSDYGNNMDSSYLPFNQAVNTSSMSSIPQVTLSPSNQSHTKTLSPNMVTVKAIPSSSKGISLLTGAPATLNLLPEMIVSPNKSQRNNSVFVSPSKKVTLNENSNFSQTTNSPKNYLVNSLLSKSGDSADEKFSKGFDPSDYENAKELAAKFRSVDDDTSADDSSDDESSDESNSSSQSETSTTNSESDSGTSDSENTEKSVMNSSRGSTPMSVMLSSHKRPSYDNSGSSSPTKRRRIIMDEKELRIPLEHGWRRQTKIRAFSYSGVRGTVIYFAPCGRKLKTYPEVIRYLDKNKINDIGRENFSFSTKVNIGEFLEPVDDANEFVHLNEQEVIARIAEIRSRKRRRSNSNRTDERKGVESPKCPIKDTKLQRKYDQQEMARRVQEIKLQKKLEREQALSAAKEAKKLKVMEDKRQKEQLRLLRQKEKHEKQEQLRIEKEIRAQQMIEARRKRQEELEKQRVEEAVRKAKERELKRQQAVMIKEQELQKRREMLIMVDLERERRRQHMLLVKALEAHKKQEERERIKEERKAAKKLNRERKLEQRRLELQFLREMKKPVEDMEIRDAEPLPTLNRIPGVKLPGKAFADLLMVIEFLHNFGEVLGFDMNNLPSINTLQNALLNDEDAEEELISTIHHLLTCAIDDPGTVVNTKHLNILNQSLKDIDITGYTVSEVLRIFVHAQLGEDNPMTIWLQEHNFLALNPSQKASILAFICNELLCSKTICRQIENNIESVNNVRRDKWMVEGKLRKSKTILSRKKLQSSIEQAEESKNVGKSNEQIKSSTSTPDVKEAEDEDESGNESETSTGTGQRDADPDEQDEENGMTADELKKQIDKLNKQLNQCRNKLIKANHQLRAVSFGQDRYKRRYWVLPYSGGIFIEGLESSEFPEELFTNLNVEDKPIKSECCDLKSDPLENTNVDNSHNLIEEKDFNANDKNVCSVDVDTKLNNSNSQKVEDNLFLQKPEDLRKLSDYIHDSVTSSSPSSSGKKTCSSIRFPTVGVNNTVTFNGLNNLKGKETNGTHINCSKCDNSIQNGNCHSTFSFCPSFCVENYRTNEKITQKPWFSLLPRMPCDETSLTRTRASSKSSCNQSLSKHYLPYSAFNIYNNNVPSFATLQMGVINGSPSSLLLNHPSLAVPNSSVSSPITPGSPSAGSLGQGSGIETPNKSSSKSESTVNLPNIMIDHSSLLEKLHQHAEAQPIPLELQGGWWRITDPNQLRLCMKNFHQRGIRERMLYKQFEKYEDFACNACGKGNEDVADLDITELDRKISQLPGGAPEENKPEEWSTEVELRVEMALLEHIEHLEDRIINSSMQAKNWKRSPKASIDKNLQFRPSCLNSEENSEEDFVSPLELSRNRLLLLESNIERRYVKPPLGNSTSELKFPSSSNSRDIADEDSTSSQEELPSALLQWRDSISKVKTSAQLAICCTVLENCIAWDKSVMKASCQLCNSGDNEAMLLLCDGCDKGYHTYCFKPKMENIPDGDWYCNECLNKASGERVCLVCGKKGKNLCICDNCPKAYHTDCLEPPVTKSPKGKWLCPHCEQKPPKTKTGSSNSSSSSSKKKKKKKKSENSNTPVSKSEKKQQEKQNSADKKNSERSKEKSKTNKDFGPCREILQEMEEHEDAWPFLLPVNTKQFPSYRKIIKKPMDLSIIKSKLQEESYKTPEDFALDIRLIFDNCETFNEDDSPVGKAGHSMRAFFETRWEEVARN